MSRTYEMLQKLYRVDGVSQSIRGKLIAYRNAVQAYAFLDSAHSDDRDQIQEELFVAEYNLLQTIKTHIKRKEEDES